VNPVPQFGQAQAGRSYADRPAAFGIAVRDGLLAVVEVKMAGRPPWRDLPGGALDPGEDAAQAAVREFGEETGLRVAASETFAKADQLFINTDGRAFNNRCVFLIVEVTGEEAALKIEADHELVWVEPQRALTELRHDAHAWAVAAWLRGGQTGFARRRPNG